MAIRGLIPQAVLLDALGTLVELLPPAPRLRTELSERFAIEVSEACAERAIAAEIRYYRSHFDEGRDPLALADLHRRCAEVLGQELAVAEKRSVPGTEALLEALLASLQFTAFADAAPALVALKELGLRTVVVSNWDVSLPEVLERIGLTPWLDGVITSSQVGVRKPDPAIFERALELAEVGPSQAIHVGDSPAEDVVGAQAAGIEAVLLVRVPAQLPDEAAPCGPRIHSLRELPGLLRAGISFR